MWGLHRLNSEKNILFDVKRSTKSEYKFISKKSRTKFPRFFYYNEIDEKHNTYGEYYTICIFISLM